MIVCFYCLTGVSISTVVESFCCFGRGEESRVAILLSSGSPNNNLAAADGKFSVIWTDLATKFSPNNKLMSEFFGNSVGVKVSQIYSLNCYKTSGTFVTGFGESCGLHYVSIEFII